MGVDWNREIKLSALFRRGAKEPKEPKAKEAKEAGGSTSFLKKEIKLSDLFRRAREPGAPKAKEAGESTSFLKKEIKLSFRRGPSGRRKGPKAAGPTARTQPKSAPPVPHVPLMRAFNLLPKEDSRQAKRRRPSTAQLVLAVAALVLFAAFASAFLIMSARVMDKRTTHDELRVKLAALDVPAEEPQEQVDPALLEERRARTASLASALGERIAWDRLLREFSLVLPEDVWLTGLIATAPRRATPEGPADPAATSSFTINGFTRRQDGVARLLARLSVLPELSSVQLLSSTSTVIGAEEVVQFSVTASVKKGA